jgi:hypothetical protein
MLQLRLRGGCGSSRAAHGGWSSGSWVAAVQQQSLQLSSSSGMQHKGFTSCSAQAVRSSRMSRLVVHL